MTTYFVYIIKCADNSFYTGVTNDVHKRFLEHSTSSDPKAYTFSRRPLKLVFYTQFNCIQTAIATEKQIKKWSKAKKQALIDGNFSLLINLAKKKF